MFTLISAFLITTFIVGVIKTYLNFIGISSILEMSSFLGLNVFIGVFLLFIITIWICTFIQRQNNSLPENMKDSWTINPFKFWWVVLSFIFGLFVIGAVMYYYLLSLSFIFQSLIDFIKRIVELNS
jgi:H+/Cl- antiporter ClcA